MSLTQFSPSIKSRPVYAPLEPNAAVPALMLADGEGGAALLEMVAKDPAILAVAHIIYVPAGAAHGADLAALKANSFCEAPSFSAVQNRFRKALADAQMGTQIYLAGTEGFIGQAMSEALEAGQPLAAIQSEHRGSIARRMQCVHCKGVTENVTIDPFTCGHCGLTLFVRDHYSRRLGAFQGVCVDAETPGEVPETVEIQP